MRANVGKMLEKFRIWSPEDTHLITTVCNIIGIWVNCYGLATRRGIVKSRRPSDYLQKNVIYQVTLINLDEEIKIASQPSRWHEAS